MMAETLGCTASDVFSAVVAVSGDCVVEPGNAGGLDKCDADYAANKAYTGGLRALKVQPTVPLPHCPAGRLTRSSHPLCVVAVCCALCAVSGARHVRPHRPVERRPPPGLSSHRGGHPALGSEGGLLSLLQLVHFPPRRIQRFSVQQLHVAALECPPRAERGRHPRVAHHQGLQHHSVPGRLSSSHRRETKRA